jgi:hypothetical protein
MMREMPDAEPIPIHELPSDAGTSGATGRGAAATERAVDLLAGIVSFGANMVVTALDGEEADERSAGLASVVAAGAGLLLEGLRAAGPVLGSVERTAGPAVANTGAAQSVGELMEHWRATYEERREDDDQRAAEDDLRRAFQRTVDTVLDQLDLTTLLIEHLDIQRVASTLDMNALVADLDMDELTDRIDMDRLTARIDIQALLDRVDMPAVAAGVIDELDLTQVIRDVTVGTTSEGVRDVRLRAVEADRMIRRIIDKILARSDGSEG